MAYAQGGRKSAVSNRWTFIQREHGCKSKRRNGGVMPECFYRASSSTSLLDSYHALPALVEVTVHVDPEGAEHHATTAHHRAGGRAQSSHKVH